jgi:probable metal-binding protein
MMVAHLEGGAMAEQIHGHAVLEMMAASGRVYTRESLRAAIDERFGAEARFYTCSAESMTADQLITFLQRRGKFHPVGDGFATDRAAICND